MTAAAKLMGEALTLLRSAPAQAETLLRAVLEAEPDNGDAKLVLSEALRRRGDLAGARALAQSDALARPAWFGAQRQLGVILAAQGDALPASIALRRAAELNPAHPSIWRELGDQLALAGDAAGAESAYARYAAAPIAEPRLAAAARALAQADASAAYAILEAYLGQFPHDVVGLRLMSEAHARAGRYGEAEACLRRCIELAPGFAYARHALGQLLLGLGRVDDALAEVRRLLQREPANAGARRLLGAIYNERGDYDDAALTYQALLREDPRRAGSWVSLGHVLKTLGRTEEGVAAYRRAIDLAPERGDAFWSLANLKTVRLSDDDVAQMRAQLARGDLDPEQRVDMSFALGKALEQRNDAAGAFDAYAQGARLRRALAPYDHTRLSAAVEAQVATLDAGFFARAGAGAPQPDPIFVVGLPRSGSTLVEQILASHSAVEGTMELPDMHNLATALAASAGAADGAYLAALAGLGGHDLSELGERYLASTRSHRKLGRAHFIDKMPNNWLHTGLIHLTLPNARIIDVRRHPMACGWSCFKQHFARGQDFSYDLADIGRYYADYVRLMAHLDAVLPGRVHRVIYEQLVADPEPHIRALLDHCGLAFEPACLRPHETARAVHTASSEQVRQPISAKGLDDWRAYEAQLGPLRDALGPVLDAYPHAP